MTRREIWSDAAYLLIIGAGVAGAPFTRSVAVLRFGLIIGWLACGGWFMLWRAEQIRRRAAQLRLAPDSSRCAVCHHHACQGDLCGSCEGPCITPEELNERLAHGVVQEWLNGHGRA